MKLYRYVGPPEIAAESGVSATRRCIEDARSVIDWARDTGQHIGTDGEVTATFVVDARGRLWIADRRSEHIACAASLQVLAAGEIVLGIESRRVEVTEVSNQSTGFCPEPSSWHAVERTLDAAGLPHPGGFTTEFEFRRCGSCGQTNIVKDGWLWCEECDAALSPSWNYDS